MTTETTRRTRTYGNWRKPQSAGILGLGSGGTAVLFAGLVIAILVVMTRGLGAGLIVGAVIAVAVMASTVRDSHGFNLVTKMGVRMGWLSSKARGENVYRSGPTGRTAWGTFQLPGVAAPLRLSEHLDSYARPFALLHSPASSTFSIVIATEPDGASLVDPEQVDVWVADWGHWLANLADEPSLEAASVTVETAPDSGTRLRREIDATMDPDAPEFARALLEEVALTYPAGSSTVRAYVALTFAASARAGGRKRAAEEMAKDIASRIAGLTSSLQSTGAGASRPVTAKELCEVVRVAYDPAAASLFDDARARGEEIDLTWQDVGPAGAEASWSTYRHDSAVSRTWAMTSVRSNVQASVLSRIMAPHRDITRKRVTLLYRPIDPARAAGMVEADVRAAQFRIPANGRQVSARDSLAVKQSQATANEEANGAGLVNFGMLVTASVMDEAYTAEAWAAVDSLSTTSRLRLRTVYGSQDSAFAAALPLGLVMNKHLRLPSEVRERL